MKVIKADLQRELKSIELYTFADLHRGDKFSDKKLILERRDYVRDTENAYCVLNGDIFNMALKNSKSDPYAEQLKPMEQVNEFIEIFEPVKHKILAIAPGNHEFRTYKEAGLDVTQLVCAQLGMSDKYSETSILLFLRFGEQSRHFLDENGNARKVLYVIFMNHGSGGGRKEGAKAIRLADMASIVDADIYIHSHTHLPMILRETSYRLDINNSSASPIDKLFVNTGAALDYGGYADAGEYRPASKSTPVIYLNGSKKECTARL